jgi:hypothetical protein
MVIEPILPAANIDRSPDDKNKYHDQTAYEKLKPIHRELKPIHRVRLTLSTRHVNKIDFWRLNERSFSGKLYRTLRKSSNRRGFIAAKP